MVDLQKSITKIKLKWTLPFRNVIDNTAFINGPEVKSFQAELETYLGVKHVSTLCQCTDGLTDSNDGAWI